MPKKEEAMLLPGKERKKERGTLGPRKSKETKRIEKRKEKRQQPGKKKGQWYYLVKKKKKKEENKKRATNCPVEKKRKNKGNLNNVHMDIFVN